MVSSSSSRARTPSRKSLEGVAAAATRAVTASTPKNRRSTPLTPVTTVKRSSGKVVKPVRDSVRARRGVASSRRKAVVSRRAAAEPPSPERSPDRRQLSAELDPPSSPPPYQTQDPQEQPVEEVEEVVVDKTFEFRVQYKVLDNRVVVQSDSEQWPSTIEATQLASNLEERIQALTEAVEGQPSRTALKVGKTFDIGFQGSQSVEKVLKQLREAPSRASSERVVVVEVILEKKTEVKGSQLRRSATQQLLSQRSSTEGSTSLAQRWSCTAQGCKNYQKLCYWSFEDRPINHRRLYGQPLVAWQAAVDQGVATVDVPPNAVGTQLNRVELQGPSAASDGSTNSRNRRLPSSSSPSKAVNVHFNFGEDGLKLFDSLGGLQRSVTHRRVSPELASSDTAPSELVENFFDWCRHSRKYWSDADHEVLKMIQGVVYVSGYDLEGLASLDAEQWHREGLKEGHRLRINKSIKRYFAERSASKTAGQPPDFWFTNITAHSPIDLT